MIKQRIVSIKQKEVCAKCKKKIKGTPGLKNGKTYCQTCYPTGRIRSNGHMRKFWNEWGMAKLK